LRAAIVAGEGPETLLLCEHDPVITLGRSARASNVLAPAAELARRGIAVERISRGGDVTFHGPGQLVGYPVVRLRGGVVDHMTAMARALIAVLAELGIEAGWRRDTPGLWVEGAKICAFGVNVHRRVAIHGFALNVAEESTSFGLGGFASPALPLIVPCGLHGARLTSVAEVTGSAPPVEKIAARVARALGAEIGVTFHSKIDAKSSRDPPTQLQCQTGSLK
jgi:lipoyl(octanoyl) transferase